MNASMSTLTTEALSFTRGENRGFSYGIHILLGTYIQRTIPHPGVFPIGTVMPPEAKAAHIGRGTLLSWADGIRRTIFANAVAAYDMRASRALSAHDRHAELVNAVALATPKEGQRHFVSRAGGSAQNCSQYPGCPSEVTLADGTRWSVHREPGARGAHACSDRWSFTRLNPELE